MRNSVVLPAPLGPMTPTMPPGGSLKVRSSISSRSPKPFLRCCGLDDQIAQARPGRDRDLAGLGGAVGVLRQQRLVGGDAGLALGLARPRRLPDPFQLALERALPRLLLLLLLRQPLLLLLQPGGVVALPGNAAAAIELQDPAGDVVEEVAVVGDGHDGAGVVVQEALEPGHRFGVEVVGRLVEQQQVGLLQQQPAQRHAPALAAGELARPSASPGGQRSASIAISTVRSRSQASAASIFSCSSACSAISCSISSAVDVLAEPGADLVEAVEQRHRRRQPIEHVALHVLAGIELRLLVADSRP